MKVTVKWNDQRNYEENPKAKVRITETADSAKKSENVNKNNDNNDNTNNLNDISLPTTSLSYNQ